MPFRAMRGLDAPGLHRVFLRVVGQFVQSVKMDKTGMISWRVTITALLLLAACSTTHYRESADREAYEAIAEKTEAVPGMLPGFSIDMSAIPELADLPVLEKDDASLTDAGEHEQGYRIVSLEKALELAVKKNRAYQNEKESLYLNALSLTLERHRFQPIFSGSAGGAYRRSTQDVTKMSGLAQAAEQAPDLVAAVGALAGTPADLLTDYATLVEQAATVTELNAPDELTAEQRSVSGQTQFGVNVLLEGGGRLAANLTSNFFRFVTGDPEVSTSSALLASFTQPLLRGAGRKIAAEQLTQAERDLLYALREFTDYRREFAVEIASNYYGVLQDRDTVRNNWQSLQGFRRSADRERAFTQEGRSTLSALGRLEQALLSNENSWTNAVRRYRQSLDQFKISLGLPADAPVVLDDAELAALREKGIVHPDIMPDDAVKVAEAARLDLYTARDRLDDAQRKVVVAANALKPGLDVGISADVPSMPGDRFQELDFQRTVIEGGLDFDLPLERKAERNAYRAALINADRAERDLSLTEDTISLDVRDAWRELDQARRNFEIGLQGVELNQRRVEEQELLAELGRATALNQVDAQNDLTRAQNELTSALVSHTVARLTFWRDMGILFIKKNGQWEDVKDGA
jgi:outer membrane protein TolC